MITQLIFTPNLLSKMTHNTGVNELDECFDGPGFLFSE